MSTDPIRASGLLDNCAEDVLERQTAGYRASRTILTICEEKNMREKLAEFAHEQWSGWMKYLFSKCTINIDGSATIPKWAVDRWQRQLKTPYAELDENEKNSDRSEADGMIAVLTTVPEGREPAAVAAEEGPTRPAPDGEVGPSDDDLALVYHDCCGGCDLMDQVGFEDAARAVLARWGRTDPAHPDPEGELTDEELVAMMPVNLRGDEEDALAFARAVEAAVIARRPAPEPPAMTDTPNRPPLWREIDRAWWSLVDTANPQASPPENDQAACVIRALRDWLVPETPEPEPGYRFEQRHIIWRHDQRLRDRLTAEADRAERGEVSDRLPNHTPPSLTTMTTLDQTRAALQRLINAVLAGLAHDDHPMGWARVDDAIAAARAALAAAPADGPAVPDGREPAAVAGEPSDEEIIEFWSDHCAGDGDVGIIRLARWGHPTTPAAPDAGEMGAFKNLLAVGGGCGGGLRLSPDQCRHLGALLERLNAQALQPVPVSERLPDAEDCDAAGKCWFFDPCDHGWWWLRPALIIDNDPEPLTHWLPVHALPLPTTTPAGQEGA